MRTPYTYLEVEAMENDYDQQIALSRIAERANDDFHKGEKIRNVNSVNYVIRKLHENDEWKETLEEIWLKELEDKLNGTKEDQVRRVINELSNGIVVSQWATDQINEIYGFKV